MSGLVDDRLLDGWMGNGGWMDGMMNGCMVD